jgi:xylulokinase
MSLLLGIDIGTSSVKALIFDSALCKVLAVHGQEYPIHTPKPGYAEQDPEDYWRTTIAAVKQVIAQAGSNAIAGISFSGQMHGTILLNRALEPIAPAIIWADARAVHEPAELVARFPDWAQIAGTNPASGFQISTLAWIAKHQPDWLGQTYRVILPKDYVRLKMTGEALTDVSDAASTGAFDVAQGRWSEELIHAAGVSPTIFPPVAASSQQAGTLRADAAEALGLPAGVPIIAGCADQPAQAIGSGLVQTGIGSVTIGTGGQVFIPYQPQGMLQTDARLHVFNHAVPQMWYVLGAILSAGSSLRWLRGIVGLQDTTNAYAILSEEAAQVPVGAQGLRFLPYLFGERTPHMDAQASGAWIGLRFHHTRGHMARAVMEGVSFALRDALTLALSLGASVDEMVIAGGGAESPVWRQILTDVLGLPLKKSRQQEQACLGAALLAGVGIGVYTDIASACATIVSYDEPTLPDTASHRLYNHYYAEYRTLYPLLHQTMHHLSD